MVMVIMQKFLRYLAFSNRIVEILEKKKWRPKNLRISFDSSMRDNN